MQLFIVVGIILFTLLFVLMSLPIYTDESLREGEPKTQRKMLD